MMGLLDDFIVRATLAGVGVSVASGPLGCFIVWRRMAYFGDATAHAAMLGVALALTVEISIVAGSGAIALLMAVIVSNLSDRFHGTDTLLGVLSHGALALGIVCVSLVGTINVDIASYLLGEILGVSVRDLAIIWGGAALVLFLLWLRWSSLLVATLSPELAYASDIDPRREQLILNVALAVVVAVAIQVIGVLLIASLLIIPAATARVYAKTPETMAALAALTGAVSAVAGMALAYRFDTPAGPSIVCVAAALFAISALYQRLGASSR